MNIAEVTLQMKWKTESHEISLPAAYSISSLKQHIESLVGVPIERQKLLNLVKGKLPADNIKLSELALKTPVHSFSLMGSTDNDILFLNAQAILSMNDIVDDFDYDGSDLSIEDDPKNRKKLVSYAEKTDIILINELRLGKKLLVLDLDYTLFDCKGPANHISSLMRPGMHQFLTTAYENYDIVIWSQTAWKYLEMKITELGILSHPSYKVAFVMDRTSMFSVSSSKGNKEYKHEVKSLEIIWKKFPQYYNAQNSVHIDDLGRNFAMNVKNGIKVKAFKITKKDAASDMELFYLERLLKEVIHPSEDVRKLDLPNWEKCQFFVVIDMQRKFVDITESDLNSEALKDEMGFRPGSLFYTPPKFTQTDFDLKPSNKISKNNIFNLNLSINKPACKMSESEINDILLSPSTAGTMIASPTNTNCVSPFDQPSANAILVPIHLSNPSSPTSQILPQLPLVKQAAEKRNFVDLDIDDVEKTVEFYNRKSQTEFKPINSDHLIKQTPQKIIQPSKQKPIISIYTTPSPNKNSVTQPAIWDKINLSFLPTKKNLLGEGRYSLVFRANYTIPPSHHLHSVAVKRVHNTPEAQATALSELFILRQIWSHPQPHPNIIRLIGTKDEADIDSRDVARSLSSPSTAVATSPVMNNSTIAVGIDPAMRILLLLEFCANGNLWDFMKANPKKLGKSTWCKFAKQIAGAVSFIHSLGIIHHDIKPHNIMLTEFNDLKISDFGTACFTYSPNTKAFLTPATPLTDGLGRGTQAYSAPELITPPSIYSFPVDVYSIGVTLYTLLSDQQPFAKVQSSVQMILGIRKGFFESGANSLRSEFLDGEGGVQGAVDICKRLVGREAGGRPTAGEVVGMIDVFEREV